MRDKKLRYQRVLIERVFGLIKQRWAILSRPSSAEKMTDTFFGACLLYNFECRRCDSWPRGIEYLRNHCADKDYPFESFKCESDDDNILG